MPWKPPIVTLASCPCERRRSNWTSGIQKTPLSSRRLHRLEARITFESVVVARHRRGAGRAGGDGRQRRRRLVGDHHLLPTVRVAGETMHYAAGGIDEAHL